MNTSPPHQQTRGCGIARPWLWLLALGLWLGGHALAGEEKYSARAVKAAFVVNLIKFIEWPVYTNDTATNQLTLGVLGSATDVEAFEAAARQSVALPRAIVVRKLGSPAEAKHCDVIYVSAEVSPDTLLKSLESAPVLTTSDHEGFAGQGGMIELVTGGPTLRFDVNLQATQKAGLKISSQLLRLARRVVPSSGKASP